MLLVFTGMQGNIENCLSCGQQKAEKKTPSLHEIIWQQTTFHHLKKNTIRLVGIGDMLHGSPESELTDGNIVLDIAQKAGFSSFVLGGEDLRFSKHAFAELSQKACHNAIPLTAVNISFKDNDNLNTCIPSHNIISYNNQKIILSGIIDIEEGNEKYKDNLIIHKDWKYRIKEYLDYSKNVLSLKIDWSIISIYSKKKPKMKKIEELASSGFADLIIIVSPYNALGEEKSLSHLSFVNDIPVAWLTDPQTFLALSFSEKEEESFKDVSTINFYKIRHFSEIEKSIQKKPHISQELQQLLDGVDKLHKQTRQEIASLEVPFSIQPYQKHSPSANWVADLLFLESSKTYKVDAAIIPSNLIGTEVSHRLSISSDHIFHMIPKDEDLFIITIDGINIESFIDTITCSTQSIHAKFPGLSLGSQLWLEQPCRVTTLWIKGKPAQEKETYRILIPDQLLYQLPDYMKEERSLSIGTIRENLTKYLLKEKIVSSAGNRRIFFTKDNILP